MSQVYPGLGDIEVPIVLIQGEHDITSAHGKVVPKEVEEERKISQTIVEKIQAKRRALVQKWSETKFPKFEDLREKYLKEFIFLKSPFIKMLVPEKAGYHGLPIFRPEKVAMDSLYLLSRGNRKQKSPPTGDSEVSH